MRFPLESFDWKLEVERRLKDAHTQITKLLRRAEQRYGEEYDKAGGGDPGVLQKARFRLGGTASDGLYRTASISAKNVDTGEVVTLNGGEYARGYWFGDSSYGGDYVRGEQLESGDWYALGAGTTFLKGTSGSAIGANSSGSVTIHGKTLTIYTIAAIGATKPIVCNWEDTDKKWYGVEVCV